MTSTASTPTAAPDPGDEPAAARSTARTTQPSAAGFRGLEVATVAADALRANVVVTGLLQASTVALLTSVLRTHMTAGRRYLRVDLAAADVADEEVEAAMVASHQAVCDLGGMLVFENAGPRVIDAISGDRLYVRPPEN